MKKYLGINLLIAILFVMPAYAAGPYIGFGVCYVHENFNLDDDQLKSIGLNTDVDNGEGIRLKAGYYFNDVFAIEFQFDYLTNFEMGDSIIIESIPLNFDGEIEIETYTLFAKMSPDIGLIKARPFVLVGFGVLHAEADLKLATAIGSLAESDTETDPRFTVGIGIDFYVQKNLSVGIETAYVWGLGDINEIRYLNVTCGVAHYF